MPWTVLAAAPTTPFTPAASHPISDSVRPWFWPEDRALRISGAYDILNIWADTTFRQPVGERPSGKYREGLALEYPGLTSDHTVDRQEIAI